MIRYSHLKSKLCEYFDFSDIVVLALMVLAGGFHDFVACLASVALLPYLFLKLHKNQCLHLKLNLFSVAVTVVVLFYGITVFWAIDAGMAFIGFLRILPIFLYMVMLWQTGKKEGLLKVLPYFAAVLVVLSSIGSLIAPISNLFLVSERLAGFFQYPNTFALFLLISELLLLKKPQLNIMDYIVLVVLIGGLLYTGSRTVFLLFLVANLAMVMLNASKKVRGLALILTAVVLAVVVVVALLGKDGNVLSRYLKIDLTQSTFVGRLLYVQDALPLLLKHPFGLGYLGYHFLQGGIQTGMYNVSYVHNDFLQAALDVGLIPAVLFFAAVVSFFFKKSVPLADKVIAGVFVLHSMFDFNLQFIGMFLLFVLLVHDNGGKTILLHNLSACKIALPILFVIQVYMCVALGLSQFTAYQAADVLYPYNTRNKLLLLEQQEDVTVANQIADEILEQNTHYYAPYSIKAKYAYSKGDFVGVIRHKKAVFERNVFRYTEYKEYCIMLINGIIAYEQMGDADSANILKQELLTAKQKIESNRDRLSKLGGMIQEQPVVTLPEDILEYIKNLDKAGDSD